MIRRSTRPHRELAHGRHAQRRKPDLRTLLGVAIIGALVAYFLFPIYWQVIASTKSTAELTSTNGLWFSFPTHLAENLQGLFTADGGVFARWLLNSALYAGVGGAACTAFAGAAGYALAHLRFHGSRLVTLCVLIGTMLPATVLALPQYLMVVQLGLADTYWAVLLPSLVSPFAVFLARMFATQAVPHTLLEAARIDGAGELRTALTIGSRLMAPGLVTIFLIEIVAIWNNFFLPLMVLSDDRYFPATLGLYVWNDRVTQTPEYQSLVILGSLLSSIPLIALFVSLQRYWRSDLATAAVKG
jgi:multiple sugar transport system permease protein